VHSSPPIISSGQSSSSSQTVSAEASTSSLPPAISTERIIRIHAYLQSVDCYVHYHGSVLMIMRIASLAALGKINTKGDKNVSLNLEQINVFDLSDLSKFKNGGLFYPHVLSFAPSNVYKEALSVSFKQYMRGTDEAAGVIFSDDENARLLKMYPGHDMEIYIRSSSLRFLYTNGCFYSVMCFLQSLYSEWVSSKRKMFSKTKKKSQMFYSRLFQTQFQIR
jgi:hypothetical protein